MGPFSIHPVFLHFILNESRELLSQSNGILSFKIFPNSTISGYITQFFPLESMSNLIVEPFSRLDFVKTIGTQIGVQNTKDYSVHWYGILIVLAWTLIFMLLSYNLLKKRDL